MFKFLRSWLFPPPKPRFPRFADTEQEMLHAAGSYDSTNGRYSIIADVIVEPQLYIPSVLFDGGSQVAISLSFSGTQIKLSDLYGRKIVAYVVTDSTVSSVPLSSPEARTEFEELRRSFEG